jgi:O-antigen/teichoic acid export membrane protein
VLLLRGLGSTEATVGYYKASANIGSLLYFLFISVSQVSFPMIAKLFAQNLWQEMRKVVNTLFLSITYTTALAFLFTSFFADVIIRVFFGEKYLPAVGVTPWYALSIGVLSIIIMLGNMMITFEHKKTYLFYLVGSLALYLAMVVLFFDKLGIYTPPVALITVAALSSILFIYIINRNYHQVFDVRSLLVNNGLLILMSAAAILLQQYLSQWMNQYISGILIFSVFTLISFFTIRQVRYAVKNSISILMTKKKD